MAGADQSGKRKLNYFRRLRPTAAREPLFRKLKKNLKISSFFKKDKVKISLARNTLFKNCLIIIFTARDKLLLISFKNLSLRKCKKDILMNRIFGDSFEILSLGKLKIVLL